jgi:carbamate kinase
VSAPPAHLARATSKVEAACDFVTRTDKRAVIGSLEHLEAMATGMAGTKIKL